MMLPFITYLLIGFFAYIALAMLSYHLRKEESSEGFLLNAIDIFLLPLWPVVIPYMLVGLIRETRSPEPVCSPALEQDNIIGSIAVTVSELRPSGRIQIGSDIIEAVCEHGVIASGEKVEVIGRDDLRVLVKNFAEQVAAPDA